MKSLVGYLGCDRYVAASSGFSPCFSLLQLRSTLQSSRVASEAREEKKGPSEGPKEGGDFFCLKFARAIGKNYSIKKKYSIIGNKSLDLYVYCEISSIMVAKGHTTSAKRGKG